MKDYALHDPLWLLALLILPLLIWVRGRRGAPVLVVPFAAAWHRPSLIPTSRWPAALAMTGLVLLVVGLARPQIVEDKREVKQQGYDLMLAIDLSGSMLAEDYERGGERINRLQAIKPIIQAFVHQRTNDRIGMVVFSGRAYTLAPLTFDHDWLSRQVARLKIGMIEDGTAIGDGLGVALTRLEQAARDQGGKRKGAFIVLMTDGANNRGTLTPEQSTEIAKSHGVPVYTIGAGRDGLVPMPVFDDAGRRLGTRRVISDLDEGQLRTISDATGGKFFRAFDVDTAEKAFAAIDQAQKIEFTAKSYLLTTELFAWVATPGAGLLFLGAVLALTPALPSRGKGSFGATGPNPASTAGRPKLATATAVSPPIEMSRPSTTLVILTSMLLAVEATIGGFGNWVQSHNISRAIGGACSPLF